MISRNIDKEVKEQMYNLVRKYEQSLVFEKVSKKVRGIINPQSIPMKHPDPRHTVHEFMSGVVADRVLDQVRSIAFLQDIYT